jgi:hypothetical protein
MKPIKTTLLCAALALAFGLPALGRRSGSQEAQGDDA